MISTIAVMLILASLLTPTQMHMARVISGESGRCEHSAQLAVAHVLGSGRNTIWYADAEPDAESMVIALTWESEPDPAPGAVYLLSDADVESGVLADQLGELVRVFECDHGMHLSAFAARGNE